LHEEELHNVYFLTEIIIMLKSTRIRWTGHLVSMDRGGMHIEFWWVSHKEVFYVDGRITLRRIIEKWTRVIWLRKGRSERRL
jgi:hypothetical protein